LEPYGGVPPKYPGFEAEYPGIEKLRLNKVNHPPHFFKEKEVQKRNIPDPAEEDETTRAPGIHQENDDTHGQKGSVNCDVAEGIDPVSPNECQEEENHDEVEKEQVVHEFQDRNPL
jgi:hypothetical protein